MEPWLDLVPPKDLPVLTAAILSPANTLVTLDRKHFIDDPTVAEKSGLTIVTPGDVLKRVRAALAEAFRK